jgi:hypothetical protein
LKIARFLFPMLVLAACASGCGSSTSATNVDPTLDTTPPPAPTSLMVSSDESTGRSTLMWAPSAAADLAGYQVWQATTGTGTFTLVGQITGDQAQINLQPVGSPTWRDYRVRAYDVTGNMSGYSNTLSTQLRPGYSAGNPDAPTPGHMDL